jgi:SpoVK/Ycf46/Vps4 family AAA+-type ATPase
VFLGCGKTTLCKGLAQKVSIRMKELFNRFYFYELNAGSLFSKWFSESSHNLSRFFEDIIQICYDPLTFVIILIDEIESLSISRTSSLSSNEPSDMLRVVNTLLTQIDHLKSFSNILILTTSNLIEIIDQALIDRSDLILFIGPPSIKTIFHIYRACFYELIEKNLIYSQIQSEELKDKLWNLAKLSQGLSGRTLRKLPMIAFSHIQQFDHFIHPEQLFKAMHQQLIYQKNTNNYLQQFNNQ